MLLDRINLYQTVLPFVDDFSHSLKRGASAVNVVAEIVCRQEGVKGYGEAAPRPYVTGETPAGTVRDIARLVRRSDFPWELNELSQLWAFIDGLPPARNRNTAVCALEMALLDVLGKIERIPILAFFPKTHYTDRICYGAAVHLADEKKTQERCRLIEDLGIRQVRLKMNHEWERNRQAIETVTAILGTDCDLRIDVNGAWDGRTALKHIPLLKAHPVRVVEQPLRPEDPELSEFAQELKAGGIHLMADESVCSLQDAARLLAEGFYDMVNIRLSKCGGFRRSLGMADFLRRHGGLFQIGCQLGESGLLSAAGRTLSLLCGDALYHDGSYDRLLLKENITSEPVSFGFGGFAGPLSGAGLGVRVSRPSLARLSAGAPCETVSRP